MMDDRTYHTEAGSLVTLSGKFYGASNILFDWFEEGACIEARPTVDMSDANEPWLIWECECCGQGQSRLYARTNTRNHAAMDG